MQSLSQNKEKKSINTSRLPRPTAGSFMRTAVLVGVVSTAPLFLNAQATKVPLQKDSVSYVKWISKILIDDNDRARFTINFIGQFDIFISNKPKKGLKITKDLILSVEDQKSLRSNPRLETKNFILVYAYEYDGVYVGRLIVWKKTPLALPPDTLK